MDEKLGFLEEKWRVVTGLHRRGLYSGRGHNVGVDRRSSKSSSSLWPTFALTTFTSSLLLPSSLWENLITGLMY